MRTLLLAVVCVLGAAGGSEDAGVSLEGGDRVKLLKDQLLPLLGSLVLFPTSEQGTGEQCSNHTKIFQQELNHYKMWAVQMADASSKLPSGVLEGSTYQLGHFDECLGVSVALPPHQEQLRGKYCLAEIQVSPLHPLHLSVVSDHWSTPNFNTSAWTQIKNDNQDRRIRRRDVIYWATCIPSACSSQDLQDSMNHSLQQVAAILNVHLKVTVDEALCQVETDFFASFTTSDFVFGAVVLVFVALVAAGTLYDQLTSNQHPSREDCGGKILHCFSATATLSNLKRVDPDRDMVPVHAVRFGCMIGILIGHHFIAISNSPLLNSRFLEHATKNPFAMPLPPLVVDSFFLVSGFLTARFILMSLDKKRLNVFSFYLHRYLRLTPVYMMVVAFHATLLDQTGSGPQWPSRVAREQHRCAKNWWTNLLYINNYVNTDELCMFQSWHVACDLHFSLLAPIVVVCLWKRPQAGSAMIALLVVTVATTLYVVTWVWDLDPTLMSFLNVMSDLSADPTFRLQYIPTHTRGIPYLFGIAAAYVHFKNPMKRNQLPKRTVCITLGATLLVMASPVMAATVFYSPYYHPTTWVSAMYAAIHRIPWSLGQAWLIIMAITGNAGFLQRILDWQLVVPVSRLSYCVFLVHNAVQLYMSATVRTPQHLAPPTIVWILIGDIVMTYAIALVVHILFEAPILRLDKTFFTKAASHKSGPPNEISKITNLNGSKCWAGDQTGLELEAQHSLLGSQPQATRVLDSEV